MDKKNIFNPYQYIRDMICIYIYIYTFFNNLYVIIFFENDCFNFFLRLGPRILTIYIECIKLFHLN